MCSAAGVAMQYRTTSSGVRATSIGAVRLPAALLVALLVTACSITDAEQLASANLIVAGRSPASTAHCRDVAALRARDVSEQGYDTPIQESVLRTVFAECMHRAPP